MVEDGVGIGKGRKFCLDCDIKLMQSINELKSRKLIANSISKARPVYYRQWSAAGKTLQTIYNSYSDHEQHLRLGE